MKKHILLFTNLVISAIIMIGFVGITWTNYQTYQVVMEDDIENISKLTSSNIYALIDNELTKPIFVAQTMANDTFLKNWLQKELSSMDDLEFGLEMRHYLLNYQQKYQYDAVYAISAQSNIYYYYDGINKMVSPANEHDDWYFDFLESDQQYVLNIDTDEVNNNELTVFVDCKIVETDGTLLGVTGVGLKMSRLQELLASYERAYDLKAILVNDQGVVQASTDSDDIGTVHIFDDGPLQYLREPILSNRDSLEINWYPEDQLDNCVITQYVKNMDWFLVIEKNTQAIRHSFEQMVQQDMAVIFIILLLLLSVSTLTIQRFNRAIHTALNTDVLTSLPNRSEFGRIFQAKRKASQCLFFFDVDHFKLINDTKGHIYGNEVLAAVAQITKELIGSAGFVARWGGDEFVGALKIPLDQSLTLFEQIMKQLSEKGLALDVTITISIGVVPIQAHQSLDALLELADRELYASKEKGGNCYSVFHQ